jgi:hypothetical protein
MVRGPGSNSFVTVNESVNEFCEGFEVSDELTASSALGLYFSDGVVDEDDRFPQSTEFLALSPIYERTDPLTPSSDLQVFSKSRFRHIYTHMFTKESKTSEKYSVSLGSSSQVSSGDITPPPSVMSTKSFVFPDSMIREPSKAFSESAVPESTEDFLDSGSLEQSESFSE